MRREIDSEQRQLLLIVDEDRRIRYVDDSAGLSLGCGHCAADHPPCWETLALRSPDGTPFCSESCEAWRSALNGAPDGHFAPLLYARNGEELPVRLSVSPLRVPHNGAMALLHRVTVDGDATAEREAIETEAAELQDCRILEALDSLTRREAEVMQLLALGETLDRIGKQLGISPLTARNHLRGSMEKLGVHRRLDAVLLWLRHADPQGDRFRGPIDDQGVDPTTR
jgi:DNA-binding CsgD family transcriptional regulator